MREMRSSIIFLGSLLSRTKEAYICYPGGCDIGIRPIDLHLNALKSWEQLSMKTEIAFAAKVMAFTALK